MMGFLSKLFQTRDETDFDKCRDCGSYDTPIGGTLCGDCLKEKAKKRG